MTNDQLTESLRAMGVDAQHVHLVSLLPLIQVAWADGEIQDAERAMILGVARKYGLLKAGDEAVLESWMAEAPSPYFQTQARKVFLHLATRAKLPGGMDRQAVIGWCWALANAAGGLFGTRMLAISGGEREALAEIAHHLNVDEVPDGWTELSLSDS